MAFDSSDDLEAQLRALAEAEAELRRREEEEAARNGARTPAAGLANAADLKRQQAPPQPGTPPLAARSPTEATQDVVERLRQEGNASMRAGDAQRAVELYSEALRPAATGVNRQMSAAAAATLYANRAAAHLALRAWEAAASDAQAAVTLEPTHVKALHRLATARCELGHFRQAVVACRAGEAALKAAGDRSCAFQPLLEQVSTAAALQGSVAAFDGRILHVRSAGEDAWLCRAAPASVEHDVEPAEQSALLAWEETDLWAGAAALTDGAQQVALADKQALLAKRKAELALSKPLSFRCIQDALDAAHDGDRIVIQLGQHNVTGVAADVRKRVLIRGEGQLGDTVLEQRANSPLFRLLVPAVVQNLVLDLCGFRECILVEGGERCTPLLEGCKIRCSGDHAVVCTGASAPTLRSCDISARKAGLLLLNTSRPCVLDCVIDGCEQQGVRAADASWPRLERCTISGCLAEGVVAMDSAGVELVSCTLKGNKGPGVDVSGRAHAALSSCTVLDNAGGIFLWDDATAVLERTRLAGGAHQAILADENSRPRAQGCAVQGEVLALSDEAAAGLNGAGHDNTFVAPTLPVSLPPEEGCFKFEADRFQRKQ